MAGFKSLRTDAARGLVLEQAHGVAARAGEGYAVDSYITGGRGRVRAIIYPTTYKARRDNAKNNTLVRAL